MWGRPALPGVGGGAVYSLGVRGDQPISRNFSGPFLARLEA
jgi:hypothetical protein